MAITTKAEKLQSPGQDRFCQDKLRAVSGIPCGHGKHGEDCLRGASMHQGSNFYYVGSSSKTLLLKSAHAIRKSEGWMKAQRTNRHNAANLQPDPWWTEHPSARGSSWSVPPLYRLVSVIARRSAKSAWTQEAGMPFRLPSISPV